MRATRTCDKATSRTLCVRVYLDAKGGAPAATPEGVSHWVRRSSEGGKVQRLPSVEARTKQTRSRNDTRGTLAITYAMCGPRFAAAVAYLAAAIRRQAVATACAALRER